MGGTGIRIQTLAHFGRSRGTRPYETSAAIGVQQIEQQLQAAQVGRTGESYLVNADKIQITRSRFTEDLVEEQTALEQVVDTLGVNEALNGVAGVGAYADYRGIMVLGAFQPLETVDWALLIEQDEAEAFTDMYKARMNMSLLSAGLLAAVIATAYFVARNFMQPLEIMAGGLDNLRVGDLNRDIPVEIKKKIMARKDEFGLAGQGLKATEEYLIEVSEMASSIAEGDLTMKVTLRSEKDEIGLALEKMVNNLRERITSLAQDSQTMRAASDQLSLVAGQSGAATAQIARAIQEVAKGVQDEATAANNAATMIGEISKAIDGVSQGAQEQAQAVQHASRLTNEMSESIAQVSDSADQVKQGAVRTTESAQGGVKTVEETIEWMQVIKEKVDLSAGRVREMGERSNEIGAIIETINDIAAQTNLLALNAAIEAARNVNEQASKAAEAAEKMKLASGELISSVDTVSSIVEENTAATEEMAASSTEVTTAVESIASVSEENSASIEEVSASTEERTAQVEEVTASAQELSSIADGLAIMVAQFKISKSRDLSGVVPVLKRDHQMWALRLDRMLAGKIHLDTESLERHETCQLGKWYYGWANGVYSDIKAFRDIEAPHQKLHERVRSAVEDYNKGELAKAEQISAEVEEYVDQVLALLDELGEVTRE